MKPGLILKLQRAASYVPCTPFTEREMRLLTLIDEILLEEGVGLSHRLTDEQFLAETVNSDG